MQQGLLTPIVLELGNLDFIQIKDKLEQIKQIGIYLEEFGQNSFIVRSYPTWIHENIEETIRQILDSYLNLDKGQSEKLFKRVAEMEAKHAVTGKSICLPQKQNKLLVICAKRLIHIMMPQGV